MSRRETLMAGAALVSALLLGCGKKEMTAEEKDQFFKQAFAEGLAKAKKETRSEPRPEPSREPQKWFDPAEAARIGDIRISVQSAGRAKIEVENTFGGGFRETDEEFFVVRLLIENLSPTKLEKFSGWHRSGYAGEATLIDDLGNKYDQAFHDDIRGQVKFGRLDPETSITTVLAFEIPVEKAVTVKLRLPGRGLGMDGEDVGFRLAAGM